MLTHKASLFALYRKICFLNYPCCIPYSLIIKSMSYLEACYLVNFVSGQTEFETSLEIGYKSDYHMLTHKASLFALYRKICFLNYPCCIINSQSYLKACWLVNLGFGSKQNLKSALDLATNLRLKQAMDLALKLNLKYSVPSIGKYFDSLESINY